ncbi:hypothetical protein GHT06_022471 [Daphnia sinensis]|uniref:Uncharacterized protein n=1 Tax=Daphnia sinensis TaxID=1820382 RepID=A0AAD5PPJ3_9CRUS|nr:hypothetical protein GHT06_022471 [Daphnia sinensis]
MGSKKRIKTASLATEHSCVRGSCSKIAYWDVDISSGNWNMDSKRTRRIRDVVTQASWWFESAAKGCPTRTTN